MTDFFLFEHSNCLAQLLEATADVALLIFNYEIKRLRIIYTEREDQVIEIQGRSSSELTAQKRVHVYVHSRFRFSRYAFRICIMRIILALRACNMRAHRVYSRVRFTGPGAESRFHFHRNVARIASANGVTFLSFPSRKQPYILLFT
jgi:hypothetical protein